MVTGSHIPADRNGLKFYSTEGEITKQHEKRITCALATPHQAAEPADAVHETTVMDAYNARYLAAYQGALQAMRIGVFEHSAVGRDHLGALLAGLGATVIPLGRSDTFVPVDTEAVLPAFQRQFRAWAVAHRLDAVVSTDADGDRPLLTDQNGRLVPGDVLGQITARALGARHVVTPISSNTGVQRAGDFDTVLRTKIGSPYVLAGMAQLAGDTVGYEANGGFILGFQAGPLAPLMTRDALLPLCAVLSLAKDRGVAALVADEPAKVTATDRLQDIIPSDADAILGRLAGDRTARAAFLDKIGVTEVAMDTTDGLRMSLTEGCTIHLRQSGNAPELRVYAEAGDHQTAQALLDAGMRRMQALLKHELMTAGQV
jgi:phosphomannomutase